MIKFSSDAKSFGRAALSRKIIPRKALLVAVVALLFVAGLGMARLGAQTSEATPQASAEQAVAPAPPEGTTLLEAEPLPSPTAPAPANTMPDPSPPAPPEPTPPLRTGDVAFSTPAARNESEPLVAIGRPVSRTDYGGSEGNRKAAQLRSMPPERFTFDRASLRDVLRFLAEAANIPFVSIPESSAQAQQLVTFRMTASPFAALEAVAKQYFIRLNFNDGVWFFSVSDGATEQQDRLDRVREVRNENELVAVIYQLRFDSPDRVDFRGEYSQSQKQLADSPSSPTSAVPTVGTPNLPLQNSQKVFIHRVPKLVNDVRAILGLQPLVVNVETGEFQESGQLSERSQGRVVDYDEMAAKARSALERRQSAEFSSQDGGGSEVVAKSDYNTEGLNLGQPDTITPLYVPPERPQVIYNADQNALWVVATRKQHKWVAEFLSKADQPQRLIAIEVKFLETKKNPQLDLGINWQDTFGGEGLQITGSASVGGDNIGSISFTDSEQASSQTGTRPADADNPAVGPYSFNTTSSSQGLSGDVPYSAVLSLNQFSVALQAFMSDRDTSIVQYPRVLTLNNKEVAITAADNTPLNVGTSTAVSATGTSGTTVGQLGYLPTGTQINILPKLLNSNQITMTVAITVSSVVGFEDLNLGTGSNRYPITSERVYNASLQVDSGYTLAVGGLEKVDDSNFEGGIPMLKDLPGLGYLFKNKNKKRNKVNLIIFITPYVIGDPAKTPGVSETPQSIVPLQPGVPPQAPTFTADGKLSGGDVALRGAFAWLEFQLSYFQQINMEAMMTHETIRKLRDVIGVARALVSDLQIQAGVPPYDPGTTTGANVLRAEQLLTDLNRTLANAQEGIY